MRSPALLLLAAVALACPCAAAAEEPPIPPGGVVPRFDGSPDKLQGAHLGFFALLDVCPRVRAAYLDFSSVRLYFAGADESSPMSDVARQTGASAMVMVSAEVGPRPKAIPARLLPRGAGRSVLFMLSDGRSGAGIAVGGPLALWLCDQTPQPGKDSAFIPSRLVGAALGAAR